MNNLQCSSKNRFSFIKFLLLFVLITLAVTINENLEADPVVIDSADSASVFVTAAHIKPSAIPDAKLLYADYEEDFAVYQWTDRHPSLAEGDTVATIDGCEGVVVSTMGTGFLVEVGRQYIYAGLSGTSILKEHETVGYVSSVKNSDYLYCIWR